MIESFLFFGPSAEFIPRSMFWLRLTNVLCMVGSLFAVLSALRHFKMFRTGGGTNPFSKLALWTVLVGMITVGISVGYRWVEVNHFPSQTMSEVLVMFSAALIVAIFVLHYALKLARMGPGWAIVDDALILMVLIGAFLTNYYSTSLSTAQRDLPPALQSYWFAPHLVALIFSYATLGIAGLIAMVYFSMRFWIGVMRGGWSFGSQALVALLLLAIPFAHWVTGPVLLVVGLILFVLNRHDVLPTRERFAVIEKQMDQVSYTAFTVGIPFLTAGLFMGAFWAQEAWANYWGWDSKENSALISWLIYVGYIHLRMLGGYRGEKAMAVLLGGAVSIFFTFQIFGYLPDSQKSLHRYTDDGVVPREGMQGASSAPSQMDEARLEMPEDGTTDGDDE